MMIIRSVVLLLVLAPLWCFAESKSKSPNIASIGDKVRLTVAVEEIGYFPYHYEEDGVAKGFTIEILEYIKANSHYEFEFVVLPWPRALYLVEHGKVDLILTLFKNDERENRYHFVEPSYGFELNQLFTLSNTPIVFNGSLDELKPYSIGTKREFSYGEAFDQANELTKVPALTEEILLKLLVGGRVDTVIANPYIFNELIKKNFLDTQIKAVKPYVEKTPVYLGLTRRRGDSELINTTFGLLIKQLKSTPEYQRLLNKYQLDF